MTLLVFVTITSVQSENAILKPQPAEASSYSGTPQAPPNCICISPLVLYLSLVAPLTACIVPIKLVHASPLMGPDPRTLSLIRRNPYGRPWYSSLEAD